MIKFNLALLLTLFTTLALNAQNLPDKQTIPLRVPPNINIDGKLDEWGKKLQAFNKNTLIYYSLANDDDNLYLAVQVVNTKIINKIISGAITLTVNNLSTKSDKKFPAISFPLLSSINGTDVRSTLKDKSTATDSLLLAINDKIKKDTKEIKFSDINEITDTITDTHTKKFEDFRWYPLYFSPGYYISKNNKLGIKVAANFEGHWKYNYELSIPLKYLRVTPGQKFTYNIRLNGPMYKTNKPTAGYTVHFSIANHVVTMKDQDLAEATDFWGDYTLAKKP